MVGLVLRFWPEYVELQRRLAGGELGRPLAVSTLRLSPPADWNDWMGDPAKSGGVPVDLLIHDFDQMNWLLGTPRRVFARAPRPDHVLAVVEYDGAEGIAEGSMAMPKAYPFSSNVRVLAEHGVAEYAFSAAPAEDGGNIGASDAPRGLRLYPTRSRRAGVGAGRARRPVGPGDRVLRRVRRTGPRRPSREPARRRAPRSLSRLPPRARSTAGGPKTFCDLAVEHRQRLWAVAAYGCGTSPHATLNVTVNPSVFGDIRPAPGIGRDL